MRAVHDTCTSSSPRAELAFRTPCPVRNVPARSPAVVMGTQDTLLERGFPAVASHAIGCAAP